MAPRRPNLPHANGAVYRTETAPTALLAQLGAIRGLADDDKEALGFLPEGAYRDAIAKGRLIAMHTADRQIVGFVLFGGVFPNARIQQIAVAPPHRRARVASALVNEVVSRLEARGYLSISAAVASDLPSAQAFYEHNGFVARRSRPGGQTRGRTIIIRARELANDNLFSVLKPVGESQTAADLGLRLRGAGAAPLYAIDLNVLFDVVKSNSRPRSAMAERLIAAALNHQIRLAIAPEFIVELERTTAGVRIDPILSLARQLPRLSVRDAAEIDQLSSVIHDIVFVVPGHHDAGTARARSDARHLAEAALARASGYVTSDGTVLDARDELLRQIGIDVASLEEFDALLPAGLTTQDSAQLRGTECTIRATSDTMIRIYLLSQHVDTAVIEAFVPSAKSGGRFNARAVVEADETVAVGVYRVPESLDAPARILVHVRPDHVAGDVFADHLLDAQCEEACRAGPVSIELPCVPGQSVVRRAATLRGFLPVPRNDALIKVALGRPVTAGSWPSVALQTRRRTGLRLPEAYPTAADVLAGLDVQGPDGTNTRLRLAVLEKMLGPTVLVWPGRSAAIIPIARGYADELLGTNDQFLLFGSPEASFLNRRTYFNSPRTAALLQPGLPILFYESQRTGGRGAVVAVARIIDTTVTSKTHVPDELLRRAVVEDLDPLSASEDVLATSFDSLLRFPRPVSFAELKQIGAAGPSNLQTATAVTGSSLAAILDMGWTRG